MSENERSHKNLFEIWFKSKFQTSTVLHLTLTSIKLPHHATNKVSKVLMVRCTSEILIRVSLRFAQTIINHSVTSEKLFSWNVFRKVPESSSLTFKDFIGRNSKKFLTKKLCKLKHISQSKWRHERKHKLSRKENQEILFLQ